MCIYVLDKFPTLWDVAVHRRNVALVHEVPDRHIPASCSAYPSMTALFSCQVFDVDALIRFLHHSNRIVRCTRTCRQQDCIQTRALIKHVV